MYFQVLQHRLIATVRERLRNGELTERSLARLTGVSQPHTHNVLKGVRILSPEIADQIMQRLHLSVLDLLSSDEMREGVLKEGDDEHQYREVQVLEGLLGPGHPMPSAANCVERFPFSSASLASLVEPVFVRLAPDPGMAGLLRANDLILLDRSEMRRTALDAEGLYVVDCGGEGAVRLLRLGGRKLYLVTADKAKQPEAWESVSLAEQNLLVFVKAKVAWVGRALPGYHVP